MLETDRLQHDRSAAWVIAQQYSSTTLVSWRFHSHKEKLGPLFLKKCFYFNILLFERKLRRSEFGSLEIVGISDYL
jgi:hypothetical protein